MGKRRKQKIIIDVFHACQHCDVGHVIYMKDGQVEAYYFYSIPQGKVVLRKLQPYISRAQYRACYRQLLESSLPPDTDFEISKLGHDIARLFCSETQNLFQAISGSSDLFSSFDAEKILSTECHIVVFYEDGEGSYAFAQKWEGEFLYIFILFSKAQVLAFINKHGEHLSLDDSRDLQKQAVSSDLPALCETNMIYLRKIPKDVFIDGMKRLTGMMSSSTSVAEKENNVPDERQ